MDLSSVTAEVALPDTGQTTKIKPIRADKGSEHPIGAGSGTDCMTVSSRASVSGYPRLRGFQSVS